jgi:hypothetical protein
MSEYQYYEFAAIDRPLTREQMSRLRALSTRATITPTRFCNFYTWGENAPETPTCGLPVPRSRYED